MPPLRAPWASVSARATPQGSCGHAVSLRGPSRGPTQPSCQIPDPCVALRTSAGYSVRPVSARPLTLTTSDVLSSVGFVGQQLLSVLTVLLKGLPCFLSVFKGFSRIQEAHIRHPLLGGSLLPGGPGSRSGKVVPEWASAPVRGGCSEGQTSRAGGLEAAYCPLCPAPSPLAPMPSVSSSLDCLAVSSAPPARGGRGRVILGSGTCVRVCRCAGT